tara:strand:+ start:43 stop:468 length:426 start_codon:yes stop_codon:yes gene_type:complete
LRKIFLASDHAGFSLKEYLKKVLYKKDFLLSDLGTKSKEKVDYPDYAHKLSRFVNKNHNSIGILICGSGQGMIMSANKHKNIRAALCHDAKSTKLSRLHNDANIITLGSRLISKKKAVKLINIFLKTEFEGGRHQKRIRKI